MFTLVKLRKLRFKIYLYLQGLLIKYLQPFGKEESYSISYKDFKSKRFFLNHKGILEYRAYRKIYTLDHEDE
jgi:hypothetical protein